MKVDLITGFLGAGKTTFIKKYADYLIRKGEKISVIEHEFGQVDRRVEFQNMLLHRAAEGFERVIVEPSGIYDVDEFFEIMLNEPVKSECEIGSILTIADARFNDALSDEARYLMFSQLLCPGKVILSKLHMIPKVMITVTVRKLNGIIWGHGSSRNLEVGKDVAAKSWDDFTDEDFADFVECGYQMVDHNRGLKKNANAFTARVLDGYCKDKEHLEKILLKLFKEDKYGQIFRVKGHIRDAGGTWYELNASESGWYIEEADVERGLFIVIGQGFDEEKVRNCFIAHDQVEQLVMQ